jgi:phosphatidyl-myo-inositol dimannoside synthase
VKNLLFLNLTAFSQTGGLEKFNRCFMKALGLASEETDLKCEAYSLYDTQSDERYFPASKYKGFGKKRLQFVASSILKGSRQDVIVLGHINLAIVGVAIKKLFPGKKLALICHGIEVWQPLQGIKKKVLEQADHILAVSAFTKDKLVTIQGLRSDKVAVFHNTIDPFFEMPIAFEKDETLMQRYGVKAHDFVLFSLCRLSSNEQYKGYDQVIEALPALLDKYPNIKYIIAGKYDELEHQRVTALVKELGVENNVILTGFIKNEEITAHYQLANTYIMPSNGEGFGIVFIEATACGVRAIAGNKDGSIDALMNGELGTLVDPMNVEEIAAAIEKNIKEGWSANAGKNLQQKTMDNFGFSAYTSRLKMLLKQIVAN